MDNKQKQAKRELQESLQRQHKTAWNEYHMLVQDLKQHISSDKQEQVISIVKRMCDAQGKFMVADYRYQETITPSNWRA